jgi:hypothetical protein
LDSLAAQTGRLGIEVIRSQIRGEGSLLTADPIHTSIPTTHPEPATDGADMHRSLKPYDAVLFDWDGTLADSQPMNFACLRDALAARGIALDSNWYRHRIGLSTDDLLRELGVKDSTSAIIIDEWRASIARRLPDLRVNSAVVELVDRARAQDLRCAVASGGAGAIVHAALTATGLVSRFRCGGRP